MLNLRNAPRGFALSGGRIPAGQDKVQVTLYAGTNPASYTADPMVIGGTFSAAVDNALAARFTRHFRPRWRRTVE